MSNKTVLTKNLRNMLTRELRDKEDKERVGRLLVKLWEFQYELEEAIDTVKANLLNNPSFKDIYFKDLKQGVVRGKSKVSDFVLMDDVVPMIIDLTGGEDSE